MKTIKSYYAFLLATLLALPSVLLLCVPATSLVAISLGAAVLTNALIADRSDSNPLYEAETDDQMNLPESDTGSMIYPCHLWAH